MHQQINLYQPVFRRQHKVFSAVTLAQILAAVLVLLLALLAHARWNLASLEATRDALQQQHDRLNARLGALDQAVNRPDADPVDAEIGRLAGAIEERKTLLVQLDRLVTRERGGYARRFEALARRQRPGLWLTGVRIDDTGAVELRGQTLDPELVPRYLQALDELPEFRDQHFDSVLLQRPSQEQPVVDFVVRNVMALEEP